MPDRTRGASRPWADQRVQALLHRAPLLHTAVDTGRGLHVTPTAFAWNGHALWVVAPRGSVKARAVRREDRVGLLLRWRRLALVGTGVAELVDPLHARGVFGLDRLVELPFAALGYVGRNTGHIAGLVRDLGPDPALALDRVVIRITPRRLAVLEDNEVRASWGDWLALPLIGDRPAPPPPLGSAFDLGGLSASLRRLLTEGGECCLAWSSPGGPLALPAEWPGDGGLVEVSAGLMSLVGAHRSGPAALAVDAGGYRLSSKHGVMLRGTGTAAERGDHALVGLHAERLTYWRGDEAGTLAAARTEPRRDDLVLEH